MAWHNSKFTRHVLVWHIAQMHHWREVVEDQLRRILDHMHINEYYIVIQGENANERARCIEWLRHYMPKAAYIESDSLANYEFPAMRAIERIAHQRDNTGTLTYIHTKGVSYPDDRQAEWREVMQRWVIDNHQLALDELRKTGADVWGWNWQHMGKISHFAGNFWVASLGYLRSLPRFEFFLDSHIWQGEKRLGAEFWIGSNHPEIMYISKGVESLSETWKKQHLLHLYHPPISSPPLG